MAYKVITKVLVYHLRPFLDIMIGSFQAAFVPGRGTLDNSILAQEAMHVIHHTRTKEGLMAIKIDFEKAYDKVINRHL